MTRKRFKKLARALATEAHLKGLHADYKAIRDWNIKTCPTLPTYDQQLRLFKEIVRIELLWEGR